MKKATSKLQDKKLKTRIDAYLARRPHRSFRRTKRRDYVRSLALPGFFAFTHYVNKTVWQYKRVLLFVGLFYAILTTIFIGIGSQTAYTALSETLRETGGEALQGNWGQLGQAGLLFLSIGTTGLNEASETSAIYGIIIGLLVWLTTVWLLRNLIAGNKVKFRDGLYSAGAPLVSTLLIVLLLVIQLLPVAVATMAYGAALNSGFLDGGVVTMLFWIIASLLALLSIYFVTSTFLALVIVTLPGMYPMRAIRAAGDMVIGRRIRILLRLLWMIFVVGLAGTLVLVPVILLDRWIKDIFPAIVDAPIVPVTILVLSTAIVIWVATYVYLLYRKVVDDDALPA